MTSEGVNHLAVLLELPHEDMAEEGGSYEIFEFL
jgi:hypothetical protein